MKRWRHEENDRTAEKKRWRLGEWRRVGWWFRRERESFALGFVERENEREPLGFYKSDTWSERVREPLGCVHLNT